MAGLRCQKCLGTLLVNKVRAMQRLQMMSAAACTRTPVDPHVITQRSGLTISSCC
jgi:hypothetical protein